MPCTVSKQIKNSMGIISLENVTEMATYLQIFFHHLVEQV